MKCTILHESRGRLRVHVCNVRMTRHRADVLEAYLNHHDAGSKAKVYERTGDVVVYYTGSRKDAVAALSTYRFDDPELDALVTSADSRRINQEYQEKMYNLVAGRVLRNLFLPAPLNAAYTVFRSIEFLWKGGCCLWRRKLEVEVLDALSIGVSILRGEFATAGSVMFLLNVGYRLAHKSGASNFGLYYEAFRQGYIGSYSYSRYSYTMYVQSGKYQNPVTNDRGAVNLIYIPTREELDGMPFTSDENREEYWKFIQNDD